MTDDRRTEITSDAPTGSLGHRAGEAPEPVSDAPVAGTVIDRYTILERVGGGGMGEVFAAYDGKLDRKVALKLLRHKSEEYESRLMREAQAMARLSHSNVVAVFDTGRVGHHLYLAMEFVRGETLRAWQRSAPRSQAEILRVYTEAGNGLAAAHHAGLVHRDFKPDNVLLAEDGRVKVTDFGIARAQEEEPDPATRAKRASVPVPALPEAATESASPVANTLPTSGSLDSPMTQEGTLLGTPGYMAPEQFLCEAVDSRTDQFSFCVSLYEALYGDKPFGPPRAAGRPQSLEEIAQATLEGKVNDAPRGASVPAHLRRVLLRGLAPVREERYPSMRELLADLARDPAAKRRRVVATAAAVVALCTVGTIFVRSANARQAKLCSATEAEAAEAWNVAAAAQAERAIVATDLPYAKDTWTRTKASLDAYMAKWKEAHKQTCEATRIHGHQTETVMTLRMSCLDQRKNEVKALAQVLGTADRDVTAKALQAAMNLTSVDVCKDVASLTAAAPEPTLPVKKAELKTLREALASAKEKLHAGRAKVAKDELVPLLPRVSALAYAPLTAEALLLSARVKSDSGAPKDESLRDAVHAFEAADEGHVDAVRADAALMAARCLRDSGSYAEAERWLRIAEGVLDRVSDRGALRADWYHTTAWIKQARGQLDENVSNERRAVELAREAGVSPVNLARHLRGLAMSEGDVGHSDEALRLLDEVDALEIKALGSEHPGRLHALLARAKNLGARGDEAGSIAAFKAALSFGDRVAPDDPSLCPAASNLCGHLADVGEPAAALPYCEKALARALPLYGKDSITLAYAQAHTGATLHELGRYQEALAHFTEALAIHRRTGSTGDLNYPASLLGVANAKLRLNDAKGALPPLEEAAASENLARIAPKDKEIGALRAELRFALGEARWSVGLRDGIALEHVRFARAEYTRLGRPANVKRIDAWLAAHAR